MSADGVGEGNQVRGTAEKRRKSLIKMRLLGNNRKSRDGETPARGGNRLFVV